MSISQRLDRIVGKLDELRRQDEDLIAFGASKHRYQLNPPASEDEVAAFESKYGVRLPEGYRVFITTLGNGGAGPWYGLEPLGNGTYDDLDFRSGAIDPGRPFPHEAAWNLDFENLGGSNDDVSDDDAYESLMEEYFDPRWVQGLIRIANYGCGVTLNLVVNGSEYGNVWVDDRGSDGGIYPDPYFDRTERTDFLTWYETWLEWSGPHLEKWRRLHTPTGAALNLPRPGLMTRIARWFGRS